MKSNPVVANIFKERKKERKKKKGGENVHDDLQIYCHLVNSPVEGVLLSSAGKSDMAASDEAA